MPIFPSNSTPWQTFLEQKKDILSKVTYEILSHQQDEYSKGVAPKIAAPSIKEIEIIECNEELVDLYNSPNKRIRVMQGKKLIQAHSHPSDIDDRSSLHGMVRSGVFVALEKMIAELDRLAPYFGYEAGELEIELFEGLRDLETQKHLFDTAAKRIQKNNPQWTEEQVYQEVSCWVSPYKNNVPVHSTGGAIDIHLWSNKKKFFCTMGRFNTGGTMAPTFTKDTKLSAEEQKNRLLMLSSATEAGLTNYVYEFWHYSYGDRYAAYWRIENPLHRKAIYASK